MADEVAGAEAPTWNPGKFSLWSQGWGDLNDALVSISLRHPTAPYPTAPLVVDTIGDDDMQQLANQYLDAVNQNPNIYRLIDLPKVQLSESPDLLTQGSGFFRWLPIGWPPENPDNANAGDPFVSFRVGRKSDDGIPIDQTVILVASEWIPKHYLGSGFGIRVVAHVQRTPANKYAIRITGLTASLPVGPYRDPDVWDLVDKNQFATIFDERTLGPVKAEMSKQLGLKNQSVSVRGARISIAKDGTPRVEWQATSKPDAKGGRAKATPYSFVFSGTPMRAGALVSKVALVADATPGNAGVFPLDPASQEPPKDIRKRRPTRREDQLDYYRDEEEITAAELGPLIFPEPPYPEPPGFFEDARVMVCPGFVLADDATLPGDAKKVDLPDTGPDTPFIRSNDFSAISAYNNVRQFFERLDAYGIGAPAYFRIANTPLKVFYRSGIRPGPGKDGQTVNARVLPEGWSADYVGPTTLGDRPFLQMHLALGDLSTRARKPWNRTNRSPAEPLGIAADARWIWHEIGHVLLMCSVGELEFRFAHSAGDALAAIVSDPRSQLAADDVWRGLTFPWVFTPRRHDRCVSHGWSWGGLLHSALAEVPNSTPPRRKGYWTEQILSSSLFRLYRCIGGDTKVVGTSGQPDHLAREFGIALFRLPHHEGNPNSADLDHRVDQPSGSIGLGADRCRHRHRSVERSVDRNLSPTTVQHRNVQLREGWRLCAQGHSLGVRGPGLVYRCRNDQQHAGPSSACRHLHPGPAAKLGGHAVRRRFLRAGQLPSGLAGMGSPPVRSGCSTPLASRRNRDRCGGRQYFREGRKPRQPTGNERHGQRLVAGMARRRSAEMERSSK